MSRADDKKDLADLIVMLKEAAVTYKNLGVDAYSKGNQEAADLMGKTAWLLRESADHLEARLPIGTNDAANAETLAQFLYCQFGVVPDAPMHTNAPDLKAAWEALENKGDWRLIAQDALATIRQIAKELPNDPDTIH
jgi:hypothetical protein